MADISNPKSVTPPQNHAFSPTKKKPAGTCWCDASPPPRLIHCQSQRLKIFLRAKVKNISREHKMNSGPKKLCRYLDSSAAQEIAVCPFLGSSSVLPNRMINPLKASTRELIAVAQ